MEIKNTPSFNFINKVRESRGGGVSIGLEKNLTFKVQSDLIPEELRCLEILLVQIIHP